MVQPTKSELIDSLDEGTEAFTIGQNTKPVNVLNAKVMSAFVDKFLQPFYDDPQPTPDFHMMMWSLISSDDSYVAVAAPRGHGKTTANTIAFTLANILFKSSDFIAIGSNTEKQAVDILDGIKLHIKYNPTIKAVWPDLILTVDTQKEIIGRVDETHYFKITVRSWTQQFRGMVWGVKRPNLVLLDDFESPEDVMSKEVRDKSYSKLATDILMCGSTYCRYRVYGTVLHEDSLLEKLLQSTTWKSLRFAAHNEDFTKILFPGKFSEKSLRAMMKGFDERGELDLYYREMLNTAVSMGDTLFKKHQFQRMVYEDDTGKDVDHWQRPMRFYVTIDFAISEKQRADYTVFLVFGLCEDGDIHVVHVERFRASAETPFRIQETFFNLLDQFHPEVFIAETEKIDKAIMPYLRLEMRKRRKYFNVMQIPSTQSKIQRSMGMVARMQARACYFNKDAYWYPTFEKELMQATPSGVKSAHDDQFDTFSMIGTYLDKYYNGPTEVELHDMEVMEYNNNIDEMMQEDGHDGIDETTGY
jgi:predicted phage terminase large subunit-like protein